MACTYCYQINKHHNFMDFETAKEFIDILLADKNPYINTKNSPGIIIEFIGGEPLLAIDLIDKITDYFVTKMIELDHPWATRFMLSMCSNGVLYFEPRYKNICKRTAIGFPSLFPLTETKSCTTRAEYFRTDPEVTIWQLQRLKTTCKNFLKNAAAK